MNRTRIFEVNFKGHRRIVESFQGVLVWLHVLEINVIFALPHHKAMFFQEVCDFIFRSTILNFLVTNFKGQRSPPGDFCKALTKKGDLFGTIRSKSIVRSLLHRNFFFRKSIFVWVKLPSVQLKDTYRGI